MPIVPAGNVIKSVAVGTPYTPVLSFNPDKKELYQTHTTNLGLLEGDCTTDGTDVTVPSGTTFIQNGIICRLTSSFVVTIPGVAFPKRVVADLTNENPGSPVTIEILADPIPAGQVILATLDPNNSTIILSKKISIRYLHDRIEALGSTTPVIDVMKDAVVVKANAEELNFTGGNVAVTDGGGFRANVAVSLDVKDPLSVTITSATKEIKFTGDHTVTMTGANAVAVDVPKLVTKDEGIVVVSQTHKLNFTGAGVTASVDGGDPNQANINIPGGGGGGPVLDQIISHNGVTVVTDAEDWDFEDAGPGIIGLLWTITDVGGDPKRGEIRGYYMDCCTWHGCGYFPGPTTVTAPANPFPGPEVISGNILLGSQSVDTTNGTPLQLSGVVVARFKFLSNGNAGGRAAVTLIASLTTGLPSTINLVTQTFEVRDLETHTFIVPFAITGLSALVLPLTIQAHARINSSNGGNPGFPEQAKFGTAPIAGLSVSDDPMGVAIYYVEKQSRNTTVLA